MQLEEQIATDSDYAADPSDDDEEEWTKSEWPIQPDLTNFNARPLRAAGPCLPVVVLFCYFSKFFTEEVFTLIDEQTNLYADQNNLKAWTPTDKNEISAFLGIIIMMSVHILPTIDHYWSTDP